MAGESALDVILGEVEYRRTWDEDGNPVPEIDYAVCLYGEFLGWIWKHRGSWFCTAGGGNKACRSRTEVTVRVLELRGVLKETA